ncbi:hypothetical protein [Beijerinckia mobilis]|uniref:hypothetical protein n=1 Tax=Beijerinckia mobilis TaxID=231434 RepID=UPI0012ECADE2|nr:hypothetical protein [Beijerinckia mobilis]
MDNLDNEKQLWCAVIHQALTDAITSSKAKNSDLIRRKARIWLTEPNDDFNKVCSLAGLEPNPTQTALIQYLADFDSGTLPVKEVKESKPQKEPIKLTYQGETKTAKQWSESLGISLTTIMKRYHLGLPIEKILYVGRLRLHKQNRICQIPAGKPSIKLTYNGETKSISHWATELGISSAVIHGRRRRGLPIERILSPKK